MPKFKPGDKIRNSNNKIISTNIYEILFVGDDKYFYKVISSSGDPYENMWDHHSFDNSYVLYTEPQTVTRWINIYKDPGGLKTSDCLFETKENALCNKDPVGWIDCIEITYTEKD